MDINQNTYRDNNVATLPEIDARIRSVSRLPSLTEAECGFLRVGIKTVERALAGDIEAIAMAFKVAERLVAITRTSEGLRQSGHFSSEVWRVERKPGSRKATTFAGLVTNKKAPERPYLALASGVRGDG